MKSRAIEYISVKSRVSEYISVKARVNEYISVKSRVSEYLSVKSRVSECIPYSAKFWWWKTLVNLANQSYHVAGNFRRD